jgi:arylsulfatase A-like enzyme
MPDKPFFVYFALRCETHAPPSRTEGLGDRYKGEFDDGWDVQSGSVRSGGKRNWGSFALTRAHRSACRDHGWDDMPEELKPVLARQMEVYAGFLEHVDHHVGRLIDAIEHLGILENTIIYYIIGDNGASAEGTLNGAFNEMANFNGMGRARDSGVHAEQGGGVRLTELLQPLLGGLGLGDERTVPVDQAGRLALGRYPQRDDRALAEWDRAGRRPALAVHPCD